MVNPELINKLNKFNFYLQEILITQFGIEDMEWNAAMAKIEEGYSDALKLLKKED